MNDMCVLAQLLKLLFTQIKTLPLYLCKPPNQQFMKINKKLLLIALSGALITTSCDKNEEENQQNPAITNNNNNDTTITYSIEQNKANMEASGVEMVNNMRDMKNSDAIKVSTHLVKIMDNFSAVALHNGAGKILFSLKEFSKSGDLHSLATNMRSVSSDPSSPQEAFDQIKGTYTYNNGNWDKTTNDNAVVIMFPSSETATSNDANVTLTYLAYNGKTPFPDYEGDLPYKINMSLKQNNTELVNYSFEANYDLNGLPTSVSTALQVSKYRLEAKMNRSNSDMGFNYSFKKDSEIYINAGAEATGNFSNTNIENLTNDTTFGENIEDITKVATSLNAHLQLMRYELKGSVNIQNLINDLKANGGKDNISPEVGVGIINKNYNLSVYDTKNNNAVVAGTEFYIDTETYTYTKQVWNEQTQTYDNVEETETSENINIRMVFPDGSKSDLETYFQKGFEKFKEEVEKFITELNNELDK
jgi:hypothetical protein